MTYELCCDTTITEGQPAVLTITLGQAAPTGGLQIATLVRLGGASTAKSGDLNIAGTIPALTLFRGLPSIAFPEGETRITLTIPTVDDTDMESTETFAVSIQIETGWTLAAGRASVVTVSIEDNDSPGIVSSRTDPAAPLTVAEGAEASYTLALRLQPSGAVQITPQSSATGAAAVSGALSFSTSNWMTPQTVTVTGVSEGTSTISHTISGATEYESLTIPDVQVMVTPPPPPASLTLRASTLTPAEGTTVTVTAVLDNPAPSGDTAVTLTPSGTAAGGGEAADYRLSSAAITIAAGEREGMATIAITSDNMTEADETIVLDAVSTNPTLTAMQITLTITDVPPADVSPGGGLDEVSRLLAPELSRLLADGAVGAVARRIARAGGEAQAGGAAAGTAAAAASAAEVTTAASGSAGGSGGAFGSVAGGSGGPAAGAADSATIAAAGSVGAAGVAAGAGGAAAANRPETPHRVDRAGAAAAGGASAAARGGLAPRAANGVAIAAAGSAAGSGGLAPGAANGAATAGGGVAGNPGNVASGGARGGAAVLGALAHRRALAVLSEGQLSLAGLAQLLDGSEFVLPLHRARQAGAGQGSKAPAWLSTLTLWGGGEYRRLENDSADLNWEADTVSARVGLDARIRDHWLLGAALAWGRGTVDDPGAEAGGGGGLQEYRLTLGSVLPYLAWTPKEGMQLWLSGGYGQGTVRLRGEERSVRSDAAQYLAAGGARVRLLARGRTRLHLRLEGQGVWLDIDGSRAGELSAHKVQTRTFRALLEGRRTVVLARGVLTPALELGVRHDGGDGDSGAAALVGGELRYQGLRGLQAQAGGELLLGRSDYREWGVWGLVSWERSPDGRGWSLRLSPRYGLGYGLGHGPDGPDASAGGFGLGSGLGSGLGNSGRLWQRGAAGAAGLDRGALAAPAPAGGRLDLRIGYGLAKGPRLLAPYSELSLADEARRLRLGVQWRLGGQWDLDLAGERLERTGADTAAPGRSPGRSPEHRLLLEGRLRY